MYGMDFYMYALLQYIDNNHKLCVIRLCDIQHSMRD